MRNENKKRLLVLSIFVAAIIIDIIFWILAIVGFSKGSEPVYNTWLYKIGFTRWGCLLVFGLVSIALFIMRYSGIEKGLFRVFVVVTMLVAIILALPWFFIMFIFKLPT